VKTPQAQLDASRRWKERNAERVKAYRSAYAAAHREENIARAKKRREAKADEIREYRRNLYETRQRETNTAAVADYRRRNPGKHSEIENRRRARLLGQFVETVDPAAIRERDLGMCGICGEFVAVEDQSLDHVVPLARGGTHEPTNVQLAHRRCNSRKGARVAA
jgi:5-methylcytosine-specific restriction endonuclease McrA